MVDYRFSLLCNSKNSGMLLSEFLERSYMSTKEFNEEFEHINHVMEDLNYDKLSLKEETIFIPNTFKDQWLAIYRGKNDYSNFIQENQRKSMIYLMIFMATEELSVFHFQNLLKVSKNTVLKDIKNVRTELSQYNIKIVYSRKNGFYILGNELKSRSFAYSSLNTLISDTTGKCLLYSYLYVLDVNVYNEVRLNLIYTQRVDNLIVVPSRFDEMSYFLSVLILRIKSSNYCFELPQEALINNLLMFETVKKFIGYFEMNIQLEDIHYITILFIVCTQGDLSDPSLNFLMNCCSEIIYEIERLAVIHFHHFKKILIELFYHLVPSYFRIMYELSIDNVLIEKIKIQYGELYALTRKSLLPFERLTKKCIPKEEVGYYTILFGGEIVNQKEQYSGRTLEAVIICPSGISSSVIMKSEFKKLFPSINFREATSVKNFSNSKVENEIDIIFSSVPIKSYKKTYVINPIMSQLEKSLLVRSIQEDFFLRENVTPSIHEILDIIVPHIELKKGTTRDELYSMLENKINKNIMKREDNRPMLSELLTENMIQLADSQENWETAIAYAAYPLKATNRIDDTYIHAMIQKVKDYGPFINIGKDVALPHARPEDGVHKLGMSLLKLTAPVLLCHDEKHPIKLFICLAAVDNETHLRALASLTKILSNKDKLNRLVEATSKNEIITMITEGEDDS